MGAIEFVDRWHRRAAECGDCYDRFFSAWIALVIEARRHLNEQQLGDPDTDRKSVILYFDNNRDSIAAVLRELPEHTVWLAARRGTATGEAILDVLPYSNQHLRQDFDELAEAWSSPTNNKPGWLATRTAELINHIRNNMFHGLKAPDDAADRELLEHVNPILMGILDIRTH